MGQQGSNNSRMATGRYNLPHLQRPKGPALQGQDVGCLQQSADPQKYLEILMPVAACVAAGVAWKNKIIALIGRASIAAALKTDQWQLTANCAIGLSLIISEFNYLSPILNRRLGMK